MSLRLHLGLIFVGSAGFGGVTGLLTTGSSSDSVVRSTTSTG